MPGSTAAQSALALITAVERQLSGAVAADLQREGVTLEQWRVLSCMDDREGRPMSGIATDAMVPPPTLTKVVDRLVAANLVHRRSDPLDRRRVLVLLTPRGRALRQRLDRIVQQHHQDWTDVLGESGLGQLTELLGRLRHVTG